MYPITMLGIICAGGVYNPTPWNLNSTEAAKHFGITGPKVVFCSEDLLDSTREACDKANIPHSKIYVVTSSPQDIYQADTGKSLIESSLLPWERIRDPDILRGTTITLHFTSGTTGLPKYSLLWTI
jgi:acyl-CoA synthetase (AMP-forming)/AMP-acid ligase II